MFLSAAPLLSSLLLPEDFLALGRQAWCIVGGEQDGDGRYMDPEWGPVATGPMCGGCCAVYSSFR